jgi:hypothetical protein
MDEGKSDLLLLEIEIAAEECNPELYLYTMCNVPDKATLPKFLRSVTFDKFKNPHTQTPVTAKDKLPLVVFCEQDHMHRNCVLCFMSI